MKKFIRIIIDILLIVVIPCFCALAIGAYGYKRYQPAFTVKAEKNAYYDANTEENNSVSEIEAYIKFESSYYKELITKEIKDENGTKLLTLKGYSVLFIDGEGKDQTKRLEYQFYAYDVDYGMLYKQVYKSAFAKKELEAFKPTITLKFIDHDTLGGDEEDIQSKVVLMSQIQSVELVDYNWNGYTKPDGTKTKKDSNGDKLIWGTDSGEAPVNTATFVADKTFSSNLDIEVYTTDSEYASEDSSTVKVGETITLTNVIQKAKEFDYEQEGIIKGFDEDIFEAGYFKYAFSRYIWWEALIALVLTLIVTGATVIVWRYSDKKEK